MKIIYLEKQEIEDESVKSTMPQVKYIESLMNNKWKNVWLDNLAFNTRQRLNKVNASRLIDALLKKHEFVIKERKE